MSLADELDALHDQLFREERLLRSDGGVLARAVEALRRMEATERMLVGKLAVRPHLNMWETGYRHGLIEALDALRGRG